MLNDLHFALRTLWRAPGFTAAAVLSLALGIGANTAIFSLLDQALLRSLPVADPGSLVLLHSDGPHPGWNTSDNNETVYSYPMYRDLRDRNPVFSGVVARAGAQVSILAGTATEIAQAETVTGNYFDVLGIRPQLGRTFRPEEDTTPGSGPVVVLEHGYWIRRFGGNPAIVGQTIRVNNHPMTVIGVLPPGFRGLLTGQAADLFVPLSMKNWISPEWTVRVGNSSEDRRVQWLNVFARLAPGVSVEKAQTAMAVVYRPILTEELATMKHQGSRFRDLFLAKKLRLPPAAQGINALRQAWGTPLTVLMALVGLVLLIACANVANLLMARAAGRRREIAIRIAVGASRLALVRQLLIESSLVAFAGGALGLLFEAAAVPLLLRLLPTDSAGAFSKGLDTRLLLFTFALSLFTGLLFGLVPAFQAASASTSSVLKDQSASVASGLGQARFRKALVTAQVALSLLLLAASGLFLRSLVNLMRHDPGFRTENVVTFAINPVLNGYTGARTAALVDDLRHRAAALPGVLSATASSIGTFTGDDRASNVSVEGYRPREEEDMDANINPVTASYFVTMGIPLLAGRDFSDSDGPDASKVAIVNQTFAKAFFHGQSPIGRHMAFGAGDGVKLEIEIVGIAKDNQTENLRDKPNRFVFIPYAQDRDRMSGVHFYVHGSRSIESLAPALRALVHRTDPNLPVTDLIAMRVRVENSASTDRLVAALSVAFGLLATLLATIGLYGVIAYTVLRRTAEIGVRLALGAARGNVLWLVMREVVLLAAGGIAAGLPLVFVVGRYVESQLFGLNARDPLVLSAAALALFAVALLAGFIPARRAMAIDPNRALRYE